MVSEKVLNVENKQLREYELIVVINPEIKDEKLDAIMNNVSQFVTGKGGTVSETERWGIKKLAYPIKHFVEGSYILTRFKLEPKWSKELETNLYISEEVLRHLLVKLGS